jgi:hypothetical protein
MELSYQFYTYTSCIFLPNTKPTRRCEKRKEKGCLLHPPIDWRVVYKKQNRFFSIESNYPGPGNNKRNTSRLREGNIIYKLVYYKYIQHVNKIIYVNEIHIYSQVYVRKLNSDMVVQMFPALFLLPFANKFEPQQETQTND